MVNPVRTWTVSDSQFFSNQASKPTQYREATVAVRDLLASGGGSVTRSNDNWAAGTDMVIGSVGAGSWSTVQMGGSFGGSTLHALVYTSEFSPTIPSTIGLSFASAPFSVGSTSAAALPTVEGGLGSSSLTYGIVPWNPVVSGLYRTWSTPQGDKLLGVKATGAQRWNSFMAVLSMQDADTGGEGLYRMCWRIGSSSSQNVLNHIFARTSWNSIRPDGGGGIAASGGSRLIHAGIQFPGGITSEGRFIYDTVKFYSSNSGNIGGRVLGQHPDWQICIENTPWAARDASERNQAFQRRSSESGVLLFYPQGSVLD